MKLEVGKFIRTPYGIRKNDYKFEWIEEKDIKSIVTKEQMEQMAYKVGE